MVEIKDLAQEVQTKFNNIAEFLGSGIRFVVTDVMQKYESYIYLKDNEIEYKYTPILVSVITPPVASAKIGLYTGTYDLRLYGYMSERHDIERICNYYMSNYSGLKYLVGDKTVRIDVGAFSIAPSNIYEARDGFADRGERFEGSLLLNLAISLNADMASGVDYKLFIDGERVEFNSISATNVKSILNTPFDSPKDRELTTDTLTITLPLINAKLTEYKNDGVIYNKCFYDYTYEFIEGDYVKVEISGDLLVSPNAPRYEFINDVFVERQDGRYVKFGSEDKYARVSHYELENDIYGAKKIAELYMLGNSAIYNSLHKIRIVNEFYDKEEEYVLTDFNTTYTSDNVPISFTLDFTLAYDRQEILLDDERVQILSYKYENVAVEDTTQKQDENGDLYNTSVLLTSAKGIVVNVKHTPKSEVTSAILMEMLGNLRYESEHTLKVKHAIYAGYIEKEDTLMIKNSSYNISSSGVIVLELVFIEKG